LESDDTDYGRCGTETELGTGRVDDWLRIHGFAIGGWWVDRTGVSEVGTGECGRMCGSVRTRVQQEIENGIGDMWDCKTEWGVEDQTNRRTESAIDRRKLWTDE